MEEFMTNSGIGKIENSFFTQLYYKRDLKSSYRYYFGRITFDLVYMNYANGIVSYVLTSEYFPNLKDIEDKKIIIHVSEKLLKVNNYFYNIFESIEYDLRDGESVVKFTLNKLLKYLLNNSEVYTVDLLKQKISESGGLASNNYTILNYYNKTFLPFKDNVDLRLLINKNINKNNTFDCSISISYKYIELFKIDVVLDSIITDKKYMEDLINVKKLSDASISISKVETTDKLFINIILNFVVGNKIFSTKVYETRLDGFGKKFTDCI